MKSPPQHQQRESEIARNNQQRYRIYTPRLQSLSRLEVDPHDVRVRRFSKNLLTLDSSHDLDLRSKGRNDVNEDEPEAAPSTHWIFFDFHKARTLTIQEGRVITSPSVFSHEAVLGWSRLSRSHPLSRFTFFFALPARLDVSHA